MFEKSKQRRGRSPERYPEVEPSGRPGAEGSVMSSWWVTLAGAVLALAGAAGVAWGLFLLGGALAPENHTNPLRDVGIAMGVGATLLGGLPCLCGVVMMWISVRRRRASSPKGWHAREW
jgi:hypothetical protein